MPDNALTLIERIQEYGLLGYIWVLFIAFWAGTVRYFTTLKEGERPTMLGWFIETIASGFVGVITAMVCQYYLLDILITSAIAGVAAHNGVKTLNFMSDVIKQKFKNH